MPPEAPKQPVVPPAAPEVVTPSIDTLLPWTDPVNNRHNVRVLCDLSGFPLAKTIRVDMPDGTIRLCNAKDIITACVYQESAFNNDAKCRNNGPTGNLLSTDWGIVQINDHYHIGPGKEFPSVEYVLANPDKAVQWMIDMYKAGKLGMWVSFSSGAYKKWL